MRDQSCLSSASSRSTSQRMVRFCDPKAPRSRRRRSRSAATCQSQSSPGYMLRPLIFQRSSAPTKLAIFRRRARARAAGVCRECLRVHRQCPNGESEQREYGFALDLFPSLHRLRATCARLPLLPVRCQLRLLTCACRRVPRALLHLLACAHAARGYHACCVSFFSPVAVAVEGGGWGGWWWWWW